MNVEVHHGKRFLGGVGVRTCAWQQLLGRQPSPAACAHQAWLRIWDDSAGKLGYQGIQGPSSWWTIRSQGMCCWNRVALVWVLKSACGRWAKGRNGGGSKSGVHMTWGALQVPRGRRPGRLIRLGMRILGASVASPASRGDTCHVVVVVDNTLLCFRRSSKLLRVLPRKSSVPPTGYHARPPAVALPGPCGPVGAPSECCRDKTSPWAVRRPPPLRAVAEAVERQAHGSAFPPLCGPPAQPRRVSTVVLS